MGLSSRYELVIFDWDGTLMNSVERIVASVQYAASSCGLPVLSFDTSKQIIGLSLERAIAQLYPQIESSLVDAMAQAYTQHFLQDCDVAMQPYEGAMLLLDKLREQGVKRAVATGKSRRGLDAVLAQTGWVEYFNCTRTPVESASKPNPLMLEQILAELNVDVSRALMVGDTTFDMEMAQAINMDRVALSHGVHSLEQMRPYQKHLLLVIRLLSPYLILMIYAWHFH